MTILGLINPGAMGASVGAAATANTKSVIWASQGRSDATMERADRAGLSDCGDLAALVSVSEVILSVCPPHEAENIARQVMQLGYSGLYTDANAVSPARTRKMRDIIVEGGAEYVDGGIIGGPAWEIGCGTRLYLSGDKADKIKRLFEDTPLEAITISPIVGAASALKMSFAAYTKGSSALLTAILAVAEREGVRSELEQQWGETLSQQAHRGAIANSAKAWRFVGEMEEISDTFSAAGLPGEFHKGAAQVFARLAGFKDAPDAPDIQKILEALLESQDSVNKKKDA
jgi:3-hydroxyisobutyrate dehydrogenase-like beta-hydroxyacid dehydrogenase